MGPCSPAQWIDSIFLLLFGIALVWGYRRYRRRAQQEPKYTKLALDGASRRAGATQLSVFDYTQNRFV